VRKMSPGQRLFQTCNEVFASTGPGIVPSPQHIEMLLSVLGMWSAPITSANSAIFFLLGFHFGHLHEASLCRT